MFRTLLYLSLFWLSLHGPSHATDLSSPMERNTFRSQDNRKGCFPSVHSPPSSHIKQNGAQQVDRLIGGLNFSCRNPVQPIKDFQDLSRYPQQPNRTLLRTVGTQPLWGRFLEANYELAYRSPFEEGGHQESTSTQHAAGRMAVQGRWAQTVYRAEWGYFGQEFNPEGTRKPRDRSGGIISWAWKLPTLEPRVEFSKFSANGEWNPSQPRSIALQQTVSLQWKRPQWPSVMMTYGRTHTKTTAFSEDTPTANFFTNRASGKLAYHQPKWEAFLQSFMSKKDDPVNRNVAQELLGYSIGGKFSPFQTLQISPKLGYQHESHQVTGIRTQSFSGQIRSSYQIGPSLTLVPDVRYQYKTHTLPHLRAKSFAASLTSRFTPTDHSMRLSFLGDFKSNRDSMQHPALQTLKFALGLDNLVLGFLNIQNYTKMVRMLVQHTQTFGFSNMSHHSRHTSGMILLSLFP